MPTRTAPPPPAPPADRRRLAGIIAAAAGFAAAELLAGILVGRFFEWGRAEALSFHGFRPGLLFIAALAAARLEWRERALLYALGLGLATAAETLLVLRLGAAAPWGEALRALLAGAALALAADLIVQAARRWGGRFGRWLAAVPLLLLLLVPGALRPYEAILLPPPAKAPAGEKPVLLLMTGLPIVWGEAGPFDPSSRPAESYRMLQAEYRVELLDTLDARSLAAGRLLLLAQPQRLSPSELVALDAWVRRGGRALILTDPALAWPSELPLGDIRRPPPVGLLAPILRHWGLDLEEGSAGTSVERVGRRRLVLQAPGRFRAAPGSCASGGRPWLARCRLGAGRALLVADADLMHDALWAPLGPERHRRTADNPLVLADWIDGLAGLERPRASGDVAWADPGRGRTSALLMALVPLLLALGAALLLARRKRLVTDLSTGAAEGTKQG